MGWNFYQGKFTVAIDLGAVRHVSEVDIYAHYDPAAGIAWPTGTTALVGLHSPARSTGIIGMSEPAVGSSGVTTRTDKPVAGSTTERVGTIVMKLANVPGRYVTVIGQGSGWILLDEIQVKDNTGAVVSTGCPYAVTPVPSVTQGTETAYGDNDERLTDTGIIPYFLPQYSQVLDGIPAGTGGTAQVTWVGERPVRTSTIWVTNPNPAFGVILPPVGVGQWRDQNGNWSSDGDVNLIADGASPHATMVLPFDAQVTGVRAILPPTNGSNGWYMVSQITAN